ARRATGLEGPPRQLRPRPSLPVAAGRAGVLGRVPRADVPALRVRQGQRPVAPRPGRGGAPRRGQEGRGRTVLRAPRCGRAHREEFDARLPPDRARVPIQVSPIIRKRGRVTSCRDRVTTRALATRTSAITLIAAAADERQCASAALGGNVLASYDLRRLRAA